MSVKKVALITAGGTGMGADAARHLSDKGYKVGILSSSGKGEALGESLGGFGITGSNRSDDAIQKLIDGAVDRWGQINVMVNSAGHGPNDDLLKLSDEDWHEGLEVYLLNVIRATRLVTPYMQTNGAGSIINISTFAAFEPDPLFPTSGIFRAGLAGFAKLYSLQYAGEGIRMNNVLPGFIDSLPATEDRIKRIPMKRYGRTEDVSSLIAWLASDNSAYMTGQNLRIDGGLTSAV